MITIVNISPAVSKKFRENSSSAKRPGGEAPESYIIYSNTLGINEAFENASMRKNSRKINGITTDRYNIKLIICRTSTNPQKAAGLNIVKPLPLAALEALREAVLAAIAVAPTATADVDATYVDFR